MVINLIVHDFSLGIIFEVPHYQPKARTACSIVIQIQETETLIENASLSDHLIEIPSLVLLGFAGYSSFSDLWMGFLLKL